ncbi:hypothetical protein ACFLTA_07355 [Bacteroidota bacterium]
MNSISNYAYAKTNFLICICLTIAMILYASIIMGSQSKCITVELPEEVSLLGLRIGYSYESAIALLEILSPEALKCYSKLLRVWDSIFPFLYGSMYIAWLSLILKKIKLKNDKLYMVNLFPFIPLLADLVENYFENALISEFILLQTLNKTSLLIASNITRIKWSFSILNYILIISGIVLLLSKIWKKRNENNSITFT